MGGNDWTGLLQELWALSLWELTDKPAQRVVRVEHLTDVVDQKCVNPPAHSGRWTGLEVQVLKRGRWSWDGQGHG
jgi:hypothetical protein